LKYIRLFLVIAVVVVAVMGQTALAALPTWTPLKHQPNFANGAGNHLLLTDGTVLCQDFDAGDWWKFTPDKTGSYINGTWSQVANMPTGYGPLWYASAVLPSGKVFVMGGEYNLGGPGVWTNLGALYDPVANSWKPVTAPSGWSNIGDAQCIILPSGRLILANPFNTEMAAFNEKTLNFTLVAASGKADAFDEEGWTLLPDGSILTVDAPNAPAAERYIPSGDLAGKWINAGSTPNSLADSSTLELGPMVLRYDGTVFALGATKYTAIYTPPTASTGAGSWAAGPNIPTVGTTQLDIEDGPCCLLPDDNVLFAASPGFGNSPMSFYEFDGAKMNPVPNTPNAPSDTSFVTTMLVLPTGQVMVTDFSNDVEIYTPAGAANKKWQPTIVSVGQNLIPGSKNNILRGTQLNGLSQCNAYGDDVQAATNYPIVRITNNATGHVFYCRTHDHSTMAVATGATIVSTQFDVPIATETGNSTVEVVANGISSNAFQIAVNRQNVVAVAISKLEGGATSGTVADTYYNDNTSFNINSVIEPGVGQVASAVVTFQPPALVNPVSTAEVDFVLAGAINVTDFVYLWNWKTNEWDYFSNSLLTNSFSSGALLLTGDQYRAHLSINGQFKVLFRGVFPQHISNAPPPFTLMVNMVQLGRT